MCLSGSQKKELQNALISAFPNKAPLKQMLDHELEKNLDAIAGGSDLQTIVFNLIEKAEAENWIKDLIDAARKSNSGNSNLKAIAEKILVKRNSEKRKNSRLENIPTTGFEASEVGADYTKLAQLLDDNNFKAANDETAERMLWVAKREQKGYLREEDIKNFPKKDLLTIDKLWLNYSDNRFGFSVQKKIWLNLGEQREYDWGTYLKFIEGLGWKKGDSVFGENLEWDLQAVVGHLPIAITSKCLNEFKMGFSQVEDIQIEFYRDLSRLLSRLFYKGNNPISQDTDSISNILLGILGGFLGSGSLYTTSVPRLLINMHPLPFLELLMNDNERLSRRRPNPDDAEIRQAIVDILDIAEKLDGYLDPKIGNFSGQIVERLRYRDGNAVAIKLILAVGIYTKFY